MLFKKIGFALCTRKQQASTLNHLFTIYRTMKCEPKSKEPQLRYQKLKNKPLGIAIPATVSLQLIGSGSNGAPNGVYLFTDNARYLFNCGEGFQRLAFEHRAKLTRLEQMFFTRNTWSMVGGLPGLLLTIQDGGTKEISLNGPPYLNDILRNMKNFVVLKRMKVNTADCTKADKYEDHVMTVKYFPIRSSVSDESKPIQDQIVIAYVCTLKPKTGALNLQKCVDQGVPPGPLLGKLKNGENVVLENGKIVRSEDVSEPAECPKSFVIFDIPNETFLPTLKEGADHFKTVISDSSVNVTNVIHFTPINILSMDDYKDFVQDTFPKDAQHIFLNGRTSSYSGFGSAHRIQYQLNLLNSKIFPLLAETENLQVDDTNVKKIKMVNNEPEQEDKKSTHELKSLLLRPPKGLLPLPESQFNAATYIDDAHKLPQFQAELKKYKELMADNINCGRTDSFPKIIFTGTGSCIPNKTRNVSGILVQTSKESFVILDCGEGTLGQLQRFYGDKKIDDVVRNLKLIYVSHLHADHHIGLIALLAARRRLTKDKILLLAPIQIQPWLEFYQSHIEDISDTYELIGNGSLLGGSATNVPAIQRIGLESIRTCLVRHCAHSFGVSLTMSPPVDGGEPVKLTYSGDTMPCEDLVELGKNSTVLIHEATMEDDLVDEAREKMHSTLSEAIQQGRKMNAKFTILTHFSQRYAKLPRMQNLTEDTEKQAQPNVAIAFDNMQVTIEDLPNFHLMFPALSALFAEYTEVLDEKAHKRTMKMERKRKLNE